MRTAIVMLGLLILTPILGGIVLVAALFNVADRPGGVYDWAPRVWARSLLWLGGTTVRVHDDGLVHDDTPRVFVSNHVSWFDVLALASVLPRYRFVGKAELLRVPLFGAAAQRAAMIPIERENRKSAFESYRKAGESIRAGASVVVFPEGTRGTSYTLRPFKKGPFVLAVAAHVPVVPTIVHGTIHVLPRGSLWLRRGTVDIHLLQPIETEGLEYEDRDGLSREAHRRMADALFSLYDVPRSTPASPVHPQSAPSLAPSR
ncbi:MAG TPA: lysophospholipid acyltransferase family protein [Gemmatimonadaceae bacterium]|nr:lysophospholipid acyltransferase family protein [Gemmatimonadaceae bacterium]